MGLYHGWSHDPDEHADFVRGGVSADDFEESFRHKKVSNKKTPKKKRGCPENDFGPHIYVWTTEYKYRDETFFDYFGFDRREWKICAGCLIVKNSRYTEEYLKRRAKTNKFMWEYSDSGYSKARMKAARRGFIYDFML